MFWTEILKVELPNLFEFHDGIPRWILRSNTTCKLIIGLMDIYRWKTTQPRVSTHTISAYLLWKNTRINHLKSCALRIIRTTEKVPDLELLHRLVVYLEPLPRPKPPRFSVSSSPRVCLVLQQPVSLIALRIILNNLALSNNEVVIR